MSDTPETQEAVERWRQGKINIFDEMARLETERNNAILELGAIQSTIAEVLNLSRAPTTSGEILLALEAHVVKSPSNPKP